MNRKQTHCRICGDLREPGSDRVLCRECRLRADREHKERRRRKKGIGLKRQPVFVVDEQTRAMRKAYARLGLQPGRIWARVPEDAGTGSSVAPVADGKRCPRCRCVKPLADFTRERTRLASWCKVCKAERARERYHARKHEPGYREAKAEYNRKHYQRRKMRAVTGGR